MAVWDEVKRVRNLAHHGVDFASLVDLDWSVAVIFEDARRDYGERRMIAMAPLGERLHVVVYVERDGEMMYISARKANSREVAFYETQTSASDA